MLLEEGQQVVIRGGAVAGAFAGMEGGDMLATALIILQEKNKLTGSGIKDRLTDYIERMITRF